MLYKKYTIIADNLEPLTCYSYDTKAEAQKQIDEWIAEDGYDDNYVISTDYWGMKQ